MARPSRSSTSELDGTASAPLMADARRSRRRRHRDRATTTPTPTTWYGSVLATFPLSQLSLYCMALHFLIAFCEMVLVAPQIALLERALCWSHYQALDPSQPVPGSFYGGGLDDGLCKIPAVQASLATIRGWKGFFDTLPVLLVAVPIGKLGDRVGRRQVMALTLVGVLGSLLEIFAVCAFPDVFPTRLIWLSSAILLCGGGLYSSAALMWAMAANAIGEKDRSKSFYYIFSAFYMAELAGSFIASITIDISPWIACGLAVLSIFVALLLLWIMPEPQKEYIPLQTHEDETQETEPLFTNDSYMEREPTSVRSIPMALSNSNMLFALPIFLVGCLRYTMLNILIQYAHVRFDWRISHGAMFYSETAIVNIFLFSFAVPRLSSFMQTHYGVKQEVVDLAMVRCSVCLMCLGTLFMAWSHSGSILPFGVAVYASGFGSRVSALSLLSYWIDDGSKAGLYASIAVLENIGHAIGDPSMHHIFAAVLSLPSTWLPLPFYVASALYGAATLSSCFIDITRRR